MRSTEGKLLGKKVDYPKNYSPEILVAVPRSLNREIYQLDDSNLPFTGWDVWHAYELGFLTEKGLPVAGLLKLVYPADSPCLVESKSLKLYLNSFNMERIGKNSQNGLQQITEIIRRDISALVQAECQLSVFNPHSETSKKNDFKSFILLESLPWAQNTSFETFTESPSLLQSGTTTSDGLNIATHLLRSNCKITHQPDWGSAFIHIKGSDMPDLKGLLQYLVSIRNENHFHEEVCEMIYQRLWDKFSPQQLMVTCIYTRRGGIDICPARASHDRLLPQFLCNTKELTHKLLRQ